MNYTENRVVGNNSYSDNSHGFKEEIKAVFESYTGSGINVINDLPSIIASPEKKQHLIEAIMESLFEDPSLTSAPVKNATFYCNYAEKAEQILENSLQEIARESAMTGYSPIVSYAPFFIKNQWVNCVYKDVLMTEVPTSPVINLAYEKRYLKAIGADGTLKEYPIPEVNYDDEKMAEILEASTGVSFDSTKDLTLPFNQAVISATYFPDLKKEPSAATAQVPGFELTPNIAITSVKFTGLDVEIPVNIRVDITTHAWIGGNVKYDQKDADGNIVKTYVGNIIGNVDYKTGKITIMDAEGAIASVKITGKLANRFNERSIDVERRVEQIQYVMPESGPRLNTAVTIEDSADALALQNIDVIADNIDVMGRTLADLEDIEIRKFLKNSFDAQEAAGVGPHGYEKLTVAGGFNTLPYDTYVGNISTWQNDVREYFERVVNELKVKLHSEQVAIVAVCHPNLIRFFKDNINWAFNEDTTISGMKLNYNFGVMTSSSDKIHFITSQYAKVDDGISLVLIPLTKELITFKHYKMHVVIDRGYRNPWTSLTPNIMATQRTLTFEVLPVQGKMTIEGRELFSPTTLKRTTTVEDNADEGGNG